MSYLCCFRTYLNFELNVIATTYSIANDTTRHACICKRWSIDKYQFQIESSYEGVLINIIGSCYTDD